MDVQSITQVNKSWIFSAGSIRDKATPETLREIYQTAKRDAAFYARMYEELTQIIDREREKLQARHCPTVEDIHALHNKLAAIDLEVQREYYLRDADKISGLYVALSDANEKRWHCEKIARQARAALEG